MDRGRNEKDLPGSAKVPPSNYAKYDVFAEIDATLTLSVVQLKTFGIAANEELKKNPAVPVIGWRDKIP